MKTYFLDIPSKFQRFSQKLDDLTLLTNQHWVSINDMSGDKTVYIFRDNKDLLISINGKIKKCRWDYIGNSSLLLDIGENSYLFKHGFKDSNILALKLDNSNEYAVFVNENKFNGDLNTIEKINSFLQEKYTGTKSLPSKITKSFERNKRKEERKKIKLEEPQIEEEKEKTTEEKKRKKEEIQRLNDQEILDAINYLKNHSITEDTLYLKIPGKNIVFPVENHEIKGNYFNHILVTKDFVDEWVQNREINYYDHILELNKKAVMDKKNLKMMQDIYSDEQDFPRNENSIYLQSDDEIMPIEYDNEHVKGCAFFKLVTREEFENWLLL